MDRLELTRGEGRARVNLLAYHLGNDLVVCIYNSHAHVGAVAVGEFDHKEGRASTSVITRLGHKDNAIAHRAAYLIGKTTRAPVCVIAGVHVDAITPEEIELILANSSDLVNDFLRSLRPTPSQIP